MRSSRREFLMVTGFAATGLKAQDDAGDQAIFSTGVKVVNLLATVRGKNGALIRDLTKDDFQVLENGRQQKIQYFSKETDLPLTLGLLIDTSLSQQKVLDAERGASFRFLDQVLREDKDHVFVLQFDFAVMLRQDVTNSRKKLEAILTEVDTPTRRELMAQQGGGTLLYDAVIKGSELMRNQRDRKALIIMSDGVDTGSEASLEAALEAAQRADTLIYSILFSDEGYYGIFGEGHGGRAALMKLSKETGGTFFEVSKKLTIDQIYAAIQDELRSQYSIGYVSDQPVRVSEFRRLQLTARQKGLTVESRDRYWAQR